MATTRKFEPGDTVRLKSGGPLMTIKTTTNDDAWCEWFDDKKMPQGKEFSLHMLEHDDGTPVIA